VKHLHCIVRRYRKCSLGLLAGTKGRLLPFSVGVRGGEERLEPSGRCIGNTLLSVKVSSKFLFFAGLSFAYLL